MKNREIVLIQDIDATSCSGCTATCTSWWGKAAPGSHISQVTLSSQMLTAVSGILFGLPLAMLIGAVVVLQVVGFDDDPMISLVCVFSVLLVAGGVIATQGAKLLSKLQVQPSVDLP